MGSAAVLYPNESERKIGFRQIFFFVCALGWLVFVLSSLEYKERAWFPVLFGGRIVLLCSAIYIFIITWLRKHIWPNIEVAFLLWSLSFQSLCGVLEGSHSTEFTNFMSVFIIITPVFHHASQRVWAYKLFPFMCAVTAAPFCFKSAEFFLSIGAFTNHFSAVVSSTLIGFLIGRSTAMKNEALLHATHLQEELTKERDQQRQIIELQAQELAESRVTARIAQATQMVAHDVRRPFSMLRSAIDIIRNSKSSDQVMARATSLIQDVEDSLNNVDNLIGDIIAISNHKPLKTVPEKPEKLIEEVIRDTLRQHPEAQVDFEFSFCHNKHIAIDPNKIRRVVSNILANAFQAMGNQGVVSISTNHKWVGRSEFVEISIHNSGPPIAAVDLPQVFDSFFTKGKQGGTGLGLAIAKTFIEAHGGQITCESSETQGVRFTFSLEAVGETYSPQIPSITPETLICEAKTVLSTKSNGGISRENHFNQKIFNILIVEDEPIFQQGLLDEIHRFKSDDYEIITTLAHSADDAHKCTAKTPPDLILLDIDLGPDSVDGLQFLREIRSQGIKTFVCIHSNRTFFGAGVTPADLGADVALPKPLNAKNLEFIIGEALKKGMCKSNRPKVIVVDDEECYLTAWKEAMTDAEVIAFLDPEVFWDEIMEKPDVLHSLSCIIFDFFFRGTDMDKLQLVRSLRSKGFCGPIILSTNAPYDNHHNSPKSRFDLVIKKRAMAFSELKAIPEVASALRKTITPNTKGKPPWLPD